MSAARARISAAWEALETARAMARGSNDPESDDTPREARRLRLEVIEKRERYEEIERAMLRAIFRRHHHPSAA